MKEAGAVERDPQGLGDQLGKDRCGRTREHLAALPGLQTGLRSRRAAMVGSGTWDSRCVCEVDWVSMTNVLSFC